MEEPSRLGPEYGGFWRRAGAAVIDFGLLLLLERGIEQVVVGLWTLSQGQVDGLGLDPGRWAVENVVRLGGLGLALVYAAAMTAGPWQATLGKRALGLRVVDRNGAPIGLGRGILRELARWISCLSLLIVILTMGLTRRRQGPHDLVAGTLVVRRGGFPASAVF